MSARAPSAIFSLWYTIHRELPRSLLGGIVGDVAHSFGYHLSRHDLPASDYSVQLAQDRAGASDAASALDVSLPPDLMQVCTRRLLAAAKARDPRLRALREFCGTLDGKTTYPWDLSSNSSEGPGTWDKSHLWHIHLSFYREFADDAAALAPIAEVFIGTPLALPPTSPNWSDMATQAEIQKMIDASIDKHLRAAVFGGDAELNKAAPGLYPDAEHGLTDRLRAVEAKVKP